MTKSRIPPLEGPSEFLFGAYLCPQSRYFHEISGYEGNGLPKVWNGRNKDSFENPVWQTATMYHTYNIPVVTVNVN